MCWRVEDCRVRAYQRFAGGAKPAHSIINNIIRGKLRLQKEKTPRIAIALSSAW